MSGNINIRRLAHSLLIAAGRGGSYSNLSLDAAIKKHSLEGADRALLTRLVLGVIERRVTLDYYIDSLSALPPGAIEPGVREALRLGLYQLIYTDKIPGFAAVNESVALVERRATGFVNALLRSYLREGNKIALPPPDGDFLLYLAVKYSFPAELCGRFVEIFGREGAERQLAALSRPPELTLRVNTLRTSREELLGRLAGAGSPAVPTKYSPSGIRLGSVSPTTLPGFSEGLFFVQDEASQLAVSALGAEGGMTVLDVCAAPGSKSFGAAIDMGNRGKILSFDLHDNKISLIKSGAARLGIDIIEPAARDGRDPDIALLGRGDRVICDVPCSGYGVMAKKPEIRHKNPASAAGLPEVQLAILEKSSDYLKPGGRLIYSTCTLLPEENEEIVGRFLASNPGFSPAPFSAGKLDVPSGMITLTPAEHGTDGFFIAVIIRNV